MEKRSLIFLIFRPLILLLFSVISVFAQENDNNGKWFFEQRAYPYDTLSITSYVNAIEYQKDLIDNLGYSISAPLQWTSIGPML
jgi:hypothetical protein